MDVSINGSSLSTYSSFTTTVSPPAFTNNSSDILSENTVLIEKYNITYKVVFISSNSISRVLQSFGLYTSFENILEKQWTQLQLHLEAKKSTSYFPKWNNDRVGRYTHTPFWKMPRIKKKSKDQRKNIIFGRFFTVTNCVVQVQWLKSLKMYYFLKFVWVYRLFRSFCLMNFLELERFLKTYFS